MKSGSLARPANRTVFLLYRPVSDASAMEDVPTFQQNGFFVVELFEANAARVLLVDIGEGFIANIDPFGLFSRSLALIDIDAILVNQKRGLIGRTGFLPAIFAHAANENEHQHPCD